MPEQPQQFRRRTRPEPPSFDEVTGSGETIPGASESDAGLAFADKDRRKNRVTQLAAEKQVQPRSVIAGAAVIKSPTGKDDGKTVRGISGVTMERFIKSQEAARAVRKPAADLQPTAADYPGDSSAAAYPDGVTSKFPPPVQTAPASLPPVIQSMHNPAVMGRELTDAEKLLKQRKRVTIELADGQFSIPIIDFRESRYSVTVLVPIDDSATTFIPKPGTELTLTCGQAIVKAFYPGAYVEYPELNCGIMTFIKADE